MYAIGKKSLRFYLVGGKYGFVYKNYCEINYHVYL